MLILFRLTAIVSKIPSPERGWGNGTAECQRREGLGKRCAANGMLWRRKGTGRLVAMYSTIALLVGSGHYLC